MDKQLSDGRLTFHENFDSEYSISGNIIQNSFDKLNKMNRF